MDICRFIPEKLSLGFSLFWKVSRYNFIFVYRRFGTIYPSQPQESSGRPRLRDLRRGTHILFHNVRKKYQPTLRNIPENGTSGLQDDGSQKSRTSVPRTHYYVKSAVVDMLMEADCGARNWRYVPTLLSTCDPHDHTSHQKSPLQADGKRKSNRIFKMSDISGSCLGSGSWKQREGTNVVLW
jgi:hypothetical protein